jgi:2-C-methyl-D-erythritol 2,4-cyclodiphosphate synthase
MSFRVGIGYDIHELKKGRRLVLGGVAVPHSKGLSGHSDADVLFHALVDAVLGAAGAGDIGEHFSNLDARWKGADSARFVSKTTEILKKKKMKIANLDAVILAEEPKLSPYRDQIRKSVAKAFGIPDSAVGIKAKTNEGLDAVGRKKAIACHAVALVEGRP